MNCEGSVYTRFMAKLTGVKNVVHLFSYRGVGLIQKGAFE